MSNLLSKGGGGLYGVVCGVLYCVVCEVCVLQSLTVVTHHLSREFLDSVACGHG